MEHNGRDALASFLVADEPLLPGGSLSLGDAVAKHIRVRRMGVGARLALLDGQGHRAVGTIVRLAPSTVVELESVSVAPPPPPVHLILPIADRDRTLWLAEKSVELALTSWRPVLFKRSRSVKPRGEGPTFNARVKSRMSSALEQSSGAYLPSMFPESTLERTLAALPQGGSRVVLDMSGEPLTALGVGEQPLVVAVGPEGGIEPEEMNLFEQHGFNRGLLGGGTLRWETAAISALAVVRTRLLEIDRNV